MWWLFKKNENPVAVLASLKHSFALWNERFEYGQIPNDVYLKKALKYQKDIAKYEKKVEKLNQN